MTQATYCRHGYPVWASDGTDLGHNCASCAKACVHGEPNGGKECARCIAADHAMDEVFATDSSDDRTLPALITPEEEIQITRRHEEAQVRLDQVRSHWDIEDNTGEGRF